MRKLISIIITINLVMSVLFSNISYVIANENEYNLNGHTYKFFNTKMTWKQAKETCEKMGGYLATFTTKEEWDYIHKYIRDNKEQYWLGGNDADNEGEWVWITGENWNYSDWCNNEPNNDYSGTEDYLGTYTSTYQWNDYRESEKLGFICEWDNTFIDSSDLLTIDNLNELLLPFTNFSSTDVYFDGASNQDETMIKTAFAILIKSPNLDSKIKKSKIDEISKGYFGKNISNHHSVGLFIYDDASEEYEIIPTGGFGEGEVKEIKEISKINDNTFKCIVNIDRVVGYDSDGNPPDIYNAEIIVRINPEAIYGMNLLSYKRISSNAYYKYFEEVEAKPISIILNSIELTFEQSPYIENGTTRVPMRAIFEALDAEVDYDADTKTITVRKGSTIIKLATGSSTATINGREMTLTAPVENKDGSTMVPLRFVSEALGAEVIWDGDTRTITINLAESSQTSTTSITKLNPIEESYIGEVADYESGYILAHKNFINSDEYKNIINYACAEEIGNSIKEDKSIQNGVLGNNILHLSFENYYDIALADIIIKQSIYDKYELMFKDGILKSQKTICDDLIKIINDDWGKDFSKSDESLVREIITSKSIESYKDDEIYKKVCDILDEKLTEEQIVKIFNASGKVSSAVDIFNNASNVIEAVQNTMNYSATLNAYLNTSDEFKKVLAYTGVMPALKYKNGLDYALLSDAINGYLDILDDEAVAKEVANKAVSEGISATYNIFKDKWINNVGSFIYTSVAVSGSEAAVATAVGKVAGAISIGYELGIAISDNLFHNNEKVAVLSTLEANGFIAENAKFALDSAQTTFIEAPTFENAKVFDEAFNFYKSIQIYSCDKSIEYDESIKTLGNIFKWKSIDENIQMAKDTKIEYENLTCH